MGEQIVKTDFSVPASIGVDTFGGKVHVEWDPHAAVTPFGQLPFFIEFVKFTTGFVAIVAMALLVLNIVTSTLQ